MLQVRTQNSQISCYKASTPNGNLDFESVLTVGATAVGLVDGLFPPEHPSPTKAGAAFIWPDNVVGCEITLESIAGGNSGFIRFNPAAAPTATVGTQLPVGATVHLGFTSAQNLLDDLLNQVLNKIRFIASAAGETATLRCRFSIDSCSNPPLTPDITPAPWPLVTLLNNPVAQVDIGATTTFDIQADDGDLVDAASFATAFIVRSPLGVETPLAQNSVVPNTGDAASLAGVFELDTTGFPAGSGYELITKTTLIDTLGNGRIAEEVIFTFDVVALAIRLLSLPGNIGGSSKFLGGVAAAGKIFFTPHNENEILWFEPGTDAMGTIPTGLSSTNKFSGLPVLLNGYIYATPRRQGLILKIDPVNLTASLIDPGDPITGTDQRWEGTPIPVGTDLYFVPSNSTNLLKLDTTNDTTTLIDITNSDTRQWYGGLYVPAVDAIYFTPRDSDTIVRYDVGAGLITKTTLPLTAATSSYLWGGTVASDGNVYLTPWSENSILKIEPNAIAANDVYTLIVSPVTGNDKWYGPMAESNGKLLASPRNADDILSVDIAAGTAAAEPTGETGTSKWHDNPYVATTGATYFTPRNNKFILKRLPDGTLSKLDTGLTATNKWVGRGVEVNGWIHFAPMDSDQLLICPIGL